MFSKLLYFLALLIIVTCHRLPMKTTNQPKITKTIFIPRVVLDYGHRSLNKMKIVPPEFCSKVTLKPETKYNVLPWWYKHCKDIRSKIEADAGRLKHYLPEHVRMLHKLQAYRKSQLLQDHLMMNFMH